MPKVTELIKMCRMLSNYIVGKVIFCSFYWKWAQKYVFNISDILHFDEIHCSRVYFWDFVAC